MTPGAARTKGRTVRSAGVALAAIVLGLLTLTSGCVTTPPPAAPPAGRVLVPFIQAPLGLPVAVPTPFARVRINRILQDGPENQILELINHGTGSQRLVNWSLTFEDGTRVYRFNTGSLPPFEGKAWVTTSQDSRLSVFSLGYFPRDAGRRYLPGGVVLLKDDQDRLVDRFVIGDIPAADATPTPSPLPSPETGTPSPSPEPAAHEAGP